MAKSRLTLDVVIEICQHLYPGPLLESKYEEPLPSARNERRVAQETLARLARVSHMVSKPALDVLWRSIDDMTVVMKVLPTFCQELWEDGFWHWNFDPRLPTSEEWKRFEAYAWRVRELRTTANFSVTCLLSLTQFWGMECDKSRPVFSRLQRLEVFHMCSNYPPAAFCSPTALRRLSIWIDIPGLTESFCPKLIFELARKMPTAMRIERDNYVQRIPKELQPFLENLECLTVEQHHGFLRNAEPSARERISFWTMTHLRELTVIHEIALTAPLLQALMDFPHLRQLALRITMRMKPEERDSLKPGFAALRDLSLEGGLDHCVVFIEAIRPLPPLERVRIGTGLPYYSLSEHEGADIERRRMRALERITDDHLKLLCAALPATLQSLCLELSRVEEAAHVQCPTLPRLLTHLAGSRASGSGLRSLTLAFGAWWRYVTEEELRMLCAPRVLWPDLVSLRFVYGSTSVDLDKQDPPSLSTLAALVETHPRLERLSIPTIDVRKFSALESPPSLAPDTEALSDEIIRPEALHTEENASDALPQTEQGPKLRETSCPLEDHDSQRTADRCDQQKHSLQLLRLDILPATVRAGALAEELDALFPNVNVIDVGEGRTSGDKAVQSLQQQLQLLVHRS